MPTIAVEIAKGAEALETRDRPLRRLPDGRVGVVFQGAVFPLIDRRRIDVSGRWFYPADCPVLMDLPAEWDLDQDAQSVNGGAKWGQLAA